MFLHWPSFFLETLAGGTLSIGQADSLTNRHDQTALILLLRQVVSPLWNDDTLCLLKVMRLATLASHLEFSELSDSI